MVWFTEIKGVANRAKEGRSSFDHQKNRSNKNAPIIKKSKSEIDNHSHFSMLQSYKKIGYCVPDRKFERSCVGKRPISRSVTKLVTKS
jgi:hypothetical protein